MIKTLAFDIDGVLVSTKELHEISFISALRQFGKDITHDDHKILDGLPTLVKLEKLGISPQSKEEIFNLKQKITFEQAQIYIKHSLYLENLFNNLDFNIAICSNAIRPFCELVVKILKIKPNLLISNEDAKSKPNSDMYLQVMKYFDNLPEEVLIFEDSKFGLQAAYGSGANVCFIKDPSYLTLERINLYLSLNS